MKKNYRFQVWLMTLLFITAAAFSQNSVNSVYRVKLDKYLQNGNRESAAELVKNQKAPLHKMQKVTIPLRGTTAYAYIAYDPSSALPEGPASFDIDDPSNMVSLAATTSSQFIAGGTWAEDTWYGVEYQTGILYTIDPNTGEMTQIGGNGIASYTGLAMVGGVMYASSITDLYTIDLTTGDATLVGAMGNGGGVMIALASDGTTLWGVDLGDDNLYTIDPSTGAATVVGPLGIDLNYAQDAEYDRDNGVLYLSAYTASGELYSVDVSTGAATLLGTLGGGCEVTGFAIPYTGVVYDNDLALLSITSPVTGVNLTDSETVTVKVKNKGVNPQSNFDISYKVNDGSPITETYTGTLDPGATDLFTFSTTEDLSTYGEYTFEACVILSGDGNVDNNCKTKVVENKVPSLCIDGLYSSGCNYGDGLTYFALVGDTVDIQCDGDPITWYHDYTTDDALTLNFSPGMEYALTAKCGYSNTYLDVWIDFNDDLYMSDDEHIINDYVMADADVDYPITFTIPSDALEGNHILRYRTNWQSGVQESCETVSYGNMADFSCVVGVGESNIVFEDNLDAYTAGQQLACQNPTDWTTWDDSPCDATEDPLISDAQSHSSSNSVNIVNDNDLVKLFKDDNDEYLTSGKYNFSFYMYIPSGNDAYWNVLQDFGATNVWGFEAYYNNGEGKVNANGTNPATTFTYSYDTWMLTELCIDLDNDSAKFSIDGTVIYEWPWSVGTSNSNLLQLAAADFYGYQQTNACSYYMDDFKLEKISSTPPQLDPPTNVTATASGSTVNVSWDAPGKNVKFRDGVTGYKIYRDGNEIAEVAADQTTYSDAGLEDGTYTYCVTALYGNEESAQACADPVDVTSGAGVVFEDNFDTYNVGEQVACQNPDNWTTWDEAPCSGTDAYVSDAASHSAPNSVSIVNDNDLVYPIANYTEGYYKLSFWTYIPAGNDGYWNVLQEFAGGSSKWGMEVLYNKNTDGEASVTAGGADAASFSFSYDTWMLNELYVNLYTDNAKFVVDGNTIIEWQWSLGASGSDGINQLGGADFYGWNEGLNGNCQYYFDDFKLEQLEYVLPDPPSNVTATATDNSVTVTWDAPNGGGSGGTEFADGFEDGTFDAWGEVIAGSGTTSWEISDTYAYQGSYGAACPWGYTIDTWLITPPIEVADGTGATFAWEGSYYWEVDPNDNGDLFVKVSTDNGATWDALWTFGEIGEWDNFTWYETTVDLSAYAGQTVLVAFNNVGDDNADVGLDEVFVGPTTKSAGTYKISSVPNIDAKAKTLPQGYVYDNKSPRGLTGYNVYRNDELISFVTETTFTDTDLASGTYTYCVSAVYDEGESQKVCADPVTVEAPSFPPPANLAGPAQVEVGDPIDLTWDAPGSAQGWIQWDDGENGNGIGAGGGAFFVASHWLPEDIAQYDGEYITKINFFVYEACNVTLKVWKGSNAGQELVSQAVSNVVEGQWNEVTLDNPVLIDASQELWFGYMVDGYAEDAHPAGTDAGPAVVGKGDMVSLDGATWVAMSTEYNLDYNWNLAAYVSSSGKGEVAVPLVKTTIENPAPAEFTAIRTNSENPVFMPSSVKSLDSYNVYRNGELVGNTTETNYSDTGYGDAGEYTYYVTAVYAEGESDPSNTITVNVITGIGENGISGLMVYPNPAKDHLTIKADEIIDNIVIYNFAGQVIVKENVNSNAYTLNASKLNKGVYMLRIETGNGTTTKRIIIE